LKGWHEFSLYISTLNHLLKFISLISVSAIHCK
jgi:hypothetical protein